MIEFNGTLFIYDHEKNLIAFKNNVESDTVLIFIAGLGDNLMTLPYMTALNTYCIENNIMFVQPQLRSTSCYGMYTLDDDVQDISKLLVHFKNNKIVFVGHSTGCQDIIYCLNETSSDLLKNIQFCILQGPVSDREYEENINKNLKEQLEIAKNNKGILPFLHNGNPINGKRFIDLFDKNGKDDMFSSDLPDLFFKNLNSRLIRMIFVLSDEDEYVINDNNKKLSLVSNSEVVKIVGANHSLVNKENEFVEILNMNLKKYCG